MPFPATKYDSDMTAEIGRAAVDGGNIREVWRALRAGTFGGYGKLDVPYSTVAHYAQRERRRRKVTVGKRPKPAPSVSIATKTEQLAHRVLDLASARLDRYGEADDWLPRDLVEVADMLGKIARVAPPMAPSDGTEAKADPLTAALLHRATVARDGPEPLKTPKGHRPNAKGRSEGQETRDSTQAAGAAEPEASADPMGWLSAT